MTTINHNGYETVVDNSLMCNASPVFRSKYYNHTEVIIEDNCSQQVFDVFLALCQGKSGVILENYQGILLQLSQKWGCNFEKYIAFSSKISDDILSLIKECNSVLETGGDASILCKKLSKNIEEVIELEEFAALPIPFICSVIEENLASVSPQKVKKLVANAVKIHKNEALLLLGSLNIGPLSYEDLFDVSEPLRQFPFLRDALTMRKPENLVKDASNSCAKDEDLFKLCQNNEYQKIDALLDSNPDLARNVDDIGASPLHVAAENGCVETMEVLCNWGANIQAKTNKGSSVLHWAVRGQHFKAVDWLLANGADPNTVDSYQIAPIHIAAEKGDIRIVASLVEKGADINLCDLCGGTPLHFASYNCRFYVCAFLLQKGADKSIKDKKISLLYCF